MEGFHNPTTKTDPYLLHMAGNWGNEKFHPFASLYVNDFVREIEAKNTQVSYRDEGPLVKILAGGQSVDDLTIATFFNGRQQSLFEKSASFFGYDFYLVGRDVTNFSWKERWVRYKEDLLPQIQTKYVLCCDATDVIICRDLQSMLKDFELYFANIKMLFNAEGNRWPSKTNIAAFEFEKSVYQSTVWQYLNAGIYLADVEFLKEHIDEVIDFKCNRRIMGDCLQNLLNIVRYLIKGNYDDQESAHNFHLNNYPKVQIDSGCQLFQVTTFLDEDLNYQGPRYS